MQHSIRAASLKLGVKLPPKNIQLSEVVTSLENLTSHDVADWSISRNLALKGAVADLRRHIQALKR